MSLSSLLHNVYYIALCGKRKDYFLLAYYPCDIFKLRQVTNLVPDFSWMKRLFENWICSRAYATGCIFLIITKAERRKKVKLETQFKAILFNNYLVASQSFGDKMWTNLKFPYKFEYIRMERTRPEIVIFPNCRFFFCFLQLALLSLFIRSASRGLHALF